MTGQNFSNHEKFVPHSIILTLPVLTLPFGESILPLEAHAIYNSTALSMSSPPADYPASLFLVPSEFRLPRPGHASFASKNGQRFTQILPPYLPMPRSSSNSHLVNLGLASLANAELPASRDQHGGGGGPR